MTAVVPDRSISPRCLISPRGKWRPRAPSRVLAPARLAHEDIGRLLLADAAARLCPDFPERRARPVAFDQPEQVDLRNLAAVAAFEDDQKPKLYHLPKCVAVAISLAKHDMDHENRGRTFGSARQESCSCDAISD